MIVSEGDIVNLKFSYCKYQRNGCDKRLSIATLDSHEKCCRFKQVQCVLHPETNCIWSGPVCSYLRHVKSLHCNSYQIIFPHNNKYHFQLRRQEIWQFKKYIFLDKSRIYLMTITNCCNYFLCCLESDTEISDSNRFRLNIACRNNRKFAFAFDGAINVWNETSETIQIFHRDFDWFNTENVLDMWIDLAATHCNDAQLHFTPNFLYKWWDLCNI